MTWSRVPERRGVCVLRTCTLTSSKSFFHRSKLTAYGTTSSCLPHTTYTLRPILDITFATSPSTPSVEKRFSQRLIVSLQSGVLSKSADCIPKKSAEAALPFVKKHLIDTEKNRDVRRRSKRSSRNSQNPHGQAMEKAGQEKHGCWHLSHECWSLPRLGCAPPLVSRQGRKLDDAGGSHMPVGAMRHRP